MILTVKNLTMKFDAKTVFEDLNFDLKEGSMTALLGPNGTGKTTLINILMKLLSPTSGSFQFKNNVKLGYVPQFRNIDAEYPLSIKDFVGLNAPLIKKGKVKQQIQHELEETHLTSIQNTRMGEASGGQKQRAYLAQALLDQPNMIILDEATASIDTESGSLITEALERLMEGRTTIMVAHRLSTIQHADKIMVIDKGEIKECGSHQELLAQRGIYHKLYELQLASQE